jgi:hypothetical protein
MIDRPILRPIPSLRAVWSSTASLTGKTGPASSRAILYFGQSIIDTHTRARQATCIGPRLNALAGCRRAGGRHITALSAQMISELFFERRPPIGCRSLLSISDSARRLQERAHQSDGNYAITSTV